MRPPCACCHPCWACLRSAAACALAPALLAPHSASSQIFFLLKESELTPSGANLLDGRYSVFGYAVQGQDNLGLMKVRATGSRPGECLLTGGGSAGAVSQRDFRAKPLQEYRLLVSTGKPLQLFVECIVLSVGRQLTACCWPCCAVLVLPAGW